MLPDLTCKGSRYSSLPIDPPQPIEAEGIRWRVWSLLHGVDMARARAGVEGSDCASRTARETDYAATCSSGSTRPAETIHDKPGCTAARGSSLVLCGAVGDDPADRLLAGTAA